MLHDDVFRTDVRTRLFSASAVIVGCLPPFKSLFKGRSTFQRYNSPAHGKDPSPDIHLDALYFGRAKTGGGGAKARAKVTSRPVHRDGKENVEYGGGDHVPDGAIGVRSDYVSFCHLRFACLVDGFEVADLFFSSFVSVGSDEA